MNRILTLLLLSASVAACAPAAEKGFEPTNGASAGNQLASDSESSAGGFSDPNQAAFAPGDCGALDLEASNLIDLDSDLIPLHAVFVLDQCGGAEPDGGSVFANGSVSIDDTAPASASFNFSRSENVTFTATNANGGSGSINYDGVFVASSSGTDYGLSDTGSSSTHFESANEGFVWDASDSRDWVVTYTPTSPAWTFADPTVGTVHIEGSWEIQVNDASGSATVSAGQNGLTVDEATCNTHITGGTMTANLEDPDGTATITATWTACGVSTVTFVRTTPGT